MPSTLNPQRRDLRDHGFLIVLFHRLDDWVIAGLQPERDRVRLCLASATAGVWQRVQFAASLVKRCLKPLDLRHHHVDPLLFNVAFGHGDNGIDGGAVACLSQT